MFFDTILINEEIKNKGKHLSNLLRFQIGFTLF